MSQQQQPVKLVVLLTLMIVSIINNNMLLVQSFTPSTVSSIRSRSVSSSSYNTNHILKAVSEKKSSYDITILSGDGIGPEIMKSTYHVLDAICTKFNIQINKIEKDMGGIAIDNHNNPFPNDTYEQCKNHCDSILLACIGGPKWDNNPRHLRPESGLLSLRQQLGLYGNLRPAKVLSQLINASTLKPSIIENVDIMVVRELTGDVYFGTPKGIDVIDGERVGYNNMIYKESEIVRIARVAGTVASQRNNKLCSVDKANVLDVSQLWRDIMTDIITTEFPHIELSHMYVDNAAMQLIRYPQQFDTIVCGNIFGDILSDEASMLVGSLGMLPSASIGDPNTPGVFEPCHGSAPDIANTDKANPLAMILSAAMMLQYDLLQVEAAKCIEDAVSAILDAGYRTMDIKQDNDNCTLVGCQEMGQKVAEYILQMDISTSSTSTSTNVVGATSDN